MRLEGVLAIPIHYTAHAKARYTSRCAPHLRHRPWEVDRLLAEAVKGARFLGRTGNKRIKVWLGDNCIALCSQERGVLVAVTIVTPDEKEMLR